MFRIWSWLSILVFLLASCQSIREKDGGCPQDLLINMELQMNRLRRLHGLSPTREVAELSLMARERSLSLSRSGQLIHAEPPRTLLKKLRLKGLARSRAAENLLRYTSGHSVIADWASHKEERANLVNPDFQWHGLGKNAGKTGCYIVLLLTD